MDERRWEGEGGLLQGFQIGILNNPPPMPRRGRWRAREKGGVPFVSWVPQRVDYDLGTSGSPSASGDQVPTSVPEGVESLRECSL